MMLGGPIPPEIESLCVRVIELTQRAKGPSYIPEATLALSCIQGAVPPAPPESAKVELDDDDVGAMIWVRIKDDETLVQFQGKGPGGRYRVKTEDGDTKLVPKESFLSFAERISGS